MLEPPVADVWRIPFSRDFLVRKARAVIFSRVRVTIRSPTSRACFTFWETQKGIVADPKGARPIASVKTAMVFAVPYMEQVPQDAQIFWRKREKVVSSIFPAL